MSQSLTSDSPLGVCVIRDRQDHLVPAQRFGFSASFLTVTQLDIN